MPAFLPGFEPGPAPTMNRATFSPCERYRYTLTREGLGGSGTVVFIGLNPSVATADVNDPTVTRCMNFARAWGAGRYVMLNLFAWRDTDPRGLLKVEDPVGPENDAVLLAETSGAKHVVAAWGSHAFLRERLLSARVAVVCGMLAKRGVELQCLGTAKDGQPRHPLYLPKDSTLRPWRRP